MFSKQTKTTVILLFYKLLLIFLAFIDNAAQMANYLYNCMVPEKSLQQNQPFWDLKKNPNICNTSVLFHSPNTASPKYREIKTQIKANTEPLRHLIWIDGKWDYNTDIDPTMYIIDYTCTYIFSYSKATLSWTVDIK